MSGEPIICRPRGSGDSACGDYGCTFAGKDCGECPDCESFRHELRQEELEAYYTYESRGF